MEAQEVARGYEGQRSGIGMGGSLFGGACAVLGGLLVWCMLRLVLRRG